MKILIAGLGKSGTTALFYKIKNSVVGDKRCLFEPPRFEPDAGDENRIIIAKVLLWDPWAPPVDYNSFNGFDKKILIVRDPRDRLVSNILYRALAFSGDEGSVRSFISSLERKEKKPDSVSVAELMSICDRSHSHSINFAERVAMSIKESIVFCNKNKDFFVIKYEDLIDEKLESLEEYLGFNLRKGSAVVDKSLRRVVRTCSYGDWKNWFTEQDIVHFKPMFERCMKQYGYADDWRINDKRVILSQYASGYVKRIIDEKRSEERDEVVKSQQCASKTKVFEFPISKLIKKLKPSKIPKIFRGKENGKRDTDT